MKAWSCSSCGAEIREEKRTDSCPLCHRKDTLSEIYLPDPTESDIKESERYNQAIEILRRYDEGTPKKRIEGGVGDCEPEEKEPDS